MTKHTHEKIFDAAKWQKLVSDDRQQMMPIEPLMQVLNAQPDELWLDVGCGPGYYTAALAKTAREVIASDLSEEMLTVCRGRMQELGHRNVRYLPSAADRVELPEHSIDGILLANVFHEVPDHQRVAQEMLRLLKPAGRLFLVEWKAVQMEMGPPLDHRLHEQMVIDVFQNAGFSLKVRHAIYAPQYILEFQTV